MLSNFNLVIASFLVSAIQPVFSEPVSIFGNPLSALARRQGAGVNTSGIPAECAAQCKPFVDAINDPACGDPIPCLCTDTHANAYKTCLDCAVANDPADISPELAQENIDDLTQECSTSGKPISIGGTSGGSQATTVSGSSGDSEATTAPGGSATTPTTTTPVGSGTTSPAAGADGSAAVGSSTGTGTDTTSASTTTTTNSGAVNLSVCSLSTVCAAVLAGAAFFGAF